MWMMEKSIAENSADVPRLVEIKIQEVSTKKLCCGKGNCTWLFLLAFHSPLLSPRCRVCMCVQVHFLENVIPGWAAAFSHSFIMAEGSQFWWGSQPALT